MNYYTIPCKPNLSQYLRFFWVLEHDCVTPAQPYTHRSMADGCCELVFHYKGRFTDIAADGSSSPSFTSGVGGPSQSFSRFHTQEAFGIFGVYMYPYAIAALCGIPASAITNQQVHLPALLGQAGKDIEEKMMLAADNYERAAILTAFFESQLTRCHKQPPPVFKAIGYIIKSKGTVTVDALAQKHFLSTRQFERNFKEFAGFSPKLYSRIIRFQAAIEKYRDKNRSLTEIAYDCGYYDQSHFIHDFKEFSGYHPKTYFSGNNEGTEWKEAE
ncbi:helix-turn-helix transcriptional regulator [Mucilaginibacter sp.]|uniref:helix-turn-helix transcriptional regulator n=1 Tax=Mucilaginibacter sp. TaxID=1882438 RepID=UPI003266C329